MPVAGGLWAFRGAVRVRWRCGAKQTKIRSKQGLGAGAGLYEQRFGLAWCLVLC